MAKRLPTFLADHEPEAILRATTRQRDRLLLMVALFMGLRVAELTHLRVEHLDFARALLWVREGKGGKDRALPIPRRLVGPLRGWIGPRQAGYVFASPRGKDRPLTSRAVQLLIKRLAVAAGLPDAEKPRRVNPHKLRHAFATRMIERGADIVAVRDALGHGSVGTTNIYVHCSGERLRKSMEV